MISDRREIASPKVLVISGLVLLLVLFAAQGLPWRLGYLDLGDISTASVSIASLCQCGSAKSCRFGGSGFGFILHTRARRIIC